MPNQALLPPRIHEAAIAAREHFTVAIQAMSPDQRPFYEVILDRMTNSQAPASSSRSTHGGFECGLIIHTHRVFSLMSAMIGGIRQDCLNQFINEPYPLVISPQETQAQFGLDRLSAFKVAFLHDVNKLATISGSDYYVPNILKSGSRSDAKPWEVNKNEGGPVSQIAKIASMANTASTAQSVEWLSVFQNEVGVQVREGAISLAVASQMAPGILHTLSDEEKFAIIYHDGAYAGRSGLSDKENVLQITLHAADMLASRFFC